MRREGGGRDELMLPQVPPLLSCPQVARHLLLSEPSRANIIQPNYVDTVLDTMWAILIYMYQFLQKIKPLANVCNHSVHAEFLLLGFCIKPSWSIKIWFS